MLNGIKVLTESYFVNGNDYSNGELCVFIFVGIVIFFGIGIRIACSYSKVLQTIGKSMLICSLIGFISLIFYSNQQSNVKQYQVTIDESVSMVEFNERYEVIEVEGKIYTIVEKENEQ